MEAEPKPWGGARTLGGATGGRVLMGAELERWAGSCCFSRGRTEEEAGPTEGKSVSEGGSSSRFQEGRGGGRREREGGWRWVPRGRVLSATRREGRGDRS